MGKQCYTCKDKLGMLNVGYAKFELTDKQKPIPHGMTDKDVLCKDCFNGHKSKSEIHEAESTIMKNQTAKALAERVSQYKPKWDKNGVIEYKDDFVAILHRMMGSQVEFIIAFSDLTREGYRLMAQDEGKTAGSGSFSGGVDSRYYFQKIQYVSNNSSN